MPTVPAGLLVDGTDAPARPESAIDVEHGRIVAIRSDATVPADTEVLDVRDHCVSPGTRS
jgi:imidazolonepropionase-like amidohydrolase